MLATPAVVTVTTGQDIFVMSSKALGASGVAATDLDLWICHQPAAGGALTQIGAAILDLRADANTRQIYSLSAVIFNLAAGTYNVGLCGTSSSPYWNSNEYSYTSALVF